MQVCGFRTSLMPICRQTGCKKLSSRFYFGYFICKKIGIIFLYKMKEDLGRFVSMFSFKKRSVEISTFLVKS